MRYKILIKLRLIKEFDDEKAAYAWAYAYLEQCPPVTEGFVGVDLEALKAESMATAT